MVLYYPNRATSPKEENETVVIPFLLPTPVGGNHPYFGLFSLFLRSPRPAIPGIWCALWGHFPRTFRASSRLPPRLLSCVFSSRSTGKRSANAPTPLLGLDLTTFDAFQR